MSCRNMMPLDHTVQSLLRPKKKDEQGGDEEFVTFTTRFSRDWGLTSAAAMMMLLPILFIFLSLQRRFIEGLTQGGLKG